MNKKAITLPYEFLVRLIIALLMVFTAIWVGRCLLSPTGEGQDSYLDLVNLVSSIQDQELKSMPLVMDKGTAIFAFSKDSDQIGIGGKGLITGQYKDAMIIKRPIACEKGKICICLCRKGWQRNDVLAFPHEMSCKETFFCNSLENIELIDTFPLKDLGIETKAFYYLFTINGGLVFERYDKTLVDDAAHLAKVTSPLLNFFSTREDFESLHGSVSPLVFDQRIRAIYVQRYKDTVAVCFKSPCITEEMKNVIDVKV